MLRADVFSVVLLERESADGTSYPDMNPFEFLSMRSLTSILFGLLIASAGCAGPESDFTETKRIDEKVTDSEFNAFLRVVRSLPGEKLPELPPVFVPPPEWNRSRTLPVGELVNEEQNLIADRWSAEQLARQMQKNRPLSRALRREQMTTEQFVGLSLAVGVAIARNTLSEVRSLDKVLKKGRIVIERLKSDSRPFSSLQRDGQHHVLQQAAWITRIDRIEKLMQVPPENIALVRAHLDTLQPMFADEFKTNPLDAVVDRLEEQGLPFEELSESGSDAEIEWNPHEAHVGTDQPDDRILQNERSNGTSAARLPVTN